MIRSILVVFTVVFLTDCIVVSTTSDNLVASEHSTSDNIVLEETGAYHTITAEEATAMIDQEEVIIVDVRTQEEYDTGHIQNAMVIPNETIGNILLESLPNTDDTILIYCRSGQRSEEAARKFLPLGYENVYDFGGVIDWPYEIVQE